MNSRKLKISFVGVGFFSQISHLINYYKNKKNVELFEVCDLDLKMAKQIKKKFKFSGKSTDNYKSLNHRKTDGIVIVLQRRLIENVAEYFLAKGCNVFTEKPSYYSSQKFLSMKKKQKGIWLKGYTRRWDKSVLYLKENFAKLSKPLGELISINYNAKNGESYLGSKHYVNPSIQKVIKSKLSNIPKFIKPKNIKLYDNHINSGCHAVDIFDFLDFSHFKNIHSEINDKYFYTKFHLSFKNKLVHAQIMLNSSKVKKWEEYMQFDFDYGSIKVIFNAPLFKKNSHKILIENGVSGKKYVKYFKLKWSFEEQTKGFIELIKKNKKHKNYSSSKDGYAMITNYENIWRSFQNEHK
tara:strand:+ start:1126 stop:2184 length:1059 start_codon:yes stop_codon:yes gene_type:complete